MINWNNTKTNGLTSLKNTVDKLDVGYLAPVSTDLSEISNVVKDGVVEKDEYNAKIKDIEDKMPNISNLATNTTLSANTTLLLMLPLKTK